MKKLFILLLVVVLSTTSLFANQLKSLLASGNKVYVEVIDTKGDIDNEYNYFIQHLNDKEEWGYWDIVKSKSDADFICKLTLTKRRTMGVARVESIVEILDNNESVLWTSKKQVGRASEFTGFNALGDTMRKVVRRSLTDELYKNNGVELK